MLTLLINTAFAADADTIISNIETQIFNPIIGIMVGISVVVFLYGVVEFIQGASNEKEVEKGKQHILYGILGFVIMAGVNGIVHLVYTTVSSIGS